MTEAPPRALASNPGKLTLSFPKLFAFEPQLSSWWRWKFHEWVNGPGEIRDRHVFFENYADHLNIGNLQAAVVLTVTPEVLVAVYTSDPDCALLMRYPAWVVAAYGLKPGSRLLSVNTYYRIKWGLAADLRQGPDAAGDWGNFVPLIAEFNTDDLDRVAEKRNGLSEEEWALTEARGRELLARPDATARDGRPSRARMPGTPLQR